MPFRAFGVLRKALGYTAFQNHMRKSEIHSVEEREKYERMKARKTCRIFIVSPFFLVLLVRLRKYVHVHQTRTANLVFFGCLRIDITLVHSWLLAK